MTRSKFTEKSGAIDQNEQGNAVTTPAVSELSDAVLDCVSGGRFYRFISAVAIPGQGTHTNTQLWVTTAT